MTLGKILYVDDEEHNLVNFKYLFKKKFEILLAKTAAEGFEILKLEHVHIVISDQKMPETSGVEFLKQVAAKFPDTIKILLTGYSDINSIIEAINHGEIYRYLTKPFQPEEMLLTLKNAMEIHNLRMQNKGLLKTLLETNEQLSIANKVLERKVNESTFHLAKVLKEIDQLRTNR